jgi:hypothetical protein
MLGIKDDGQVILVEPYLAIIVLVLTDDIRIVWSHS